MKLNVGDNTRVMKLGNLFERASAMLASTGIWLSSVFIVMGSHSLADDCSNCNFDYQNLAFADFSKSDLSGASFRNAYLVGANFTNAILDSTDFSGAIANAAIFRGADLKNTLFYGAELELTNFSDANFQNTDFTRAYLVHSKIDDASHAKIIFCRTTIFNATVNDKDC